MSKIKPIPSPDEIDSALERFRQELAEAGEKPQALEPALKRAVTELTPAQEVRLLRLDLSNEELIDESGKSYALTQVRRSLLLRCLHSKEALFTNDVRREAEYDPSLDNPFDAPVKSLLLAPFIHGEEVSALLWAAIPPRDLNQFVRGDLEIVERLAALIPPGLLICSDTKEAKEEESQEALAQESKHEEPAPEKNSDKEKPSEEDPAPIEEEEKRTPSPKKSSQTPEEKKRSGIEAPTLIKAIRSLLKSKKS